MRIQIRIVQYNNYYQRDVGTMTVELETVNELSSRTGWPKSRIRKLVENRELRHVRIGGGIYIPTGAIEEFIKNNTIEPVVEKKSSATPEA